MALQIDELESADRGVLRQASVMGVRFTRADLMAALELDEAAADAVLERLEGFLAAGDDDGLLPACAAAGRGLPRALVPPAPRSPPPGGRGPRARRGRPTSGRRRRPHAPFLRGRRVGQGAPLRPDRGLGRARRLRERRCRPVLDRAVAAGARWRGRPARGGDARGRGARRRATVPRRVRAGADRLRDRAHARPRRRRRARAAPPQGRRRRHRLGDVFARRGASSRWRCASSKVQQRSRDRSARPHRGTGSASSRCGAAGRAKRWSCSSARSRRRVGRARRGRRARARRARRGLQRPRRPARGTTAPGARALPRSSATSSARAACSTTSGRARTSPAAGTRRSSSTARAACVGSGGRHAQRLDGELQHRRDPLGPGPARRGRAAAARGRTRQPRERRRRTSPNR